MHERYKGYELISSVKQILTWSKHGKIDMKDETQFADQQQNCLISCVKLFLENILNILIQLSLIKVTAERFVSS